MVSDPFLEGTAFLKKKDNCLLFTTYWKFDSIKLNFLITVLVGFFFSLVSGDFFICLIFQDCLAPGHSSEGVLKAEAEQADWPCRKVSVCSYQPHWVAEFKTLFLTLEAPSCLWFPWQHLMVGLRTQETKKGAVFVRAPVFVLEIKGKTLFHSNFLLLSKQTKHLQKTTGGIDKAAWDYTSSPLTPEINEVGKENGVSYGNGVSLLRSICTDSQKLVVVHFNCKFKKSKHQSGKPWSKLFF